MKMNNEKNKIQKSFFQNLPNNKIKKLIKKMLFSKP